MQRERQKTTFDYDFQPQSEFSKEERTIQALEYIAYQLGQINRKLDRITERSDERERSSHESP